MTMKYFIQLTRQPDMTGLFVTFIRSSEEKTEYLDCPRSMRWWEDENWIEIKPLELIPRWCHIPYKIERELLYAIESAVVNYLKGRG